MLRERAARILEDWSDWDAARKGGSVVNKFPSGMRAKLAPDGEHALTPEEHKALDDHARSGESRWGVISQNPTLLSALGKVGKASMPAGPVRHDDPIAPRDLPYKDGRPVRQAEGMREAGQEGHWVSLGGGRHIFMDDSHPSAGDNTARLDSSYSYRGWMKGAVDKLHDAVYTHVAGQRGARPTSGPATLKAATDAANELAQHGVSATAKGAGDMSTGLQQAHPDGRVHTELSPERAGTVFLPTWGAGRAGRKQAESMREAKADWGKILGDRYGLKSGEVMTGGGVMGGRQAAAIAGKALAGGDVSKELPQGRGKVPPEQNEYEHLRGDIGRPTKSILKHLADAHGITDVPKARKGYENEVARGKHESVHRMDAGGIGHDKTGAATFEKKEPAVRFITYDGRVIPIHDGGGAMGESSKMEARGRRIVEAWMEREGGVPLFVSDKGEAGGEEVVKHHDGERVRVWPSGEGWSAVVKGRGQEAVASADGRDAAIQAAVDMARKLGPARQAAPRRQSAGGLDPRVAGAKDFSGGVERGREQDYSGSSAVDATATTGQDAEEREFDPDVGGGVDRDKIPAEDFAGKNRSFPIVTPEDVSHAARSIGRAGADNHGPDTLKANIKRIARKKGPKFVAKLPDEWTGRAGQVSER